MQTFSDQGDAHLISLLGELAEPARRADALTQLRALPDLFWTQDRTEGALSALLPLAHAEDDEERAFLLWNLLSALLAHSPQPPIGALAGLLEAATAEIRGFAATALGSLEARQSAPAMLRALAREPRWDVAMRLIGALHHLDLRPSADDLEALLQAPTEEGAAWAAAALRDHERGPRRRDLALQGLRRGDLSSAARAALTVALSRADLESARAQLPALFPEQGATEDAPPGAHQWRLFEHHKLRMTLALRFCAEPGDDTLPAATSLRLDLRLPGVHGPQEARALAAALQHAVGARGATRADSDPARDGAWMAWAPLEPLSPQTALAALSHLVEPLQRAVARLDRGAREDGAFVQQALAALLEELHDRAQLTLSLRRRFPQALGGRAPDGAQRARLATAQRRELGALLLQDLAALSSAATGAGITALLCPASPQPPALAARLAQLLTWKTGARWEPLDADLARATAALAGATHPALAIGARSADLARASGDPSALRVALSRWLDNLTALTDQGASLSELLGLAPTPWAPAQQPEPDDLDLDQDEPPTLDGPRQRLQRLLSARERAPQPEDAPAPPPQAPAAPSAPTPAPRLPPAAAAQRAPALPSKAAPALPPSGAPAAPPAPPKAPTQEAPAQEAPTPTTAPAPEAPRAARPDPGAGAAPLDDQGRTPAEVLKSLNANIETVDVYLRSAGYNHTKLAQIMSILLGMTPAQARACIEQAPGILLENVPRDRARTIRTVLEGTGAKIAITTPGDAPPPQD